MICNQILAADVSDHRAEYATLRATGHNDFGQVPVRLGPSVFQSDEAIVAVFAHEVHEITRLRELFQANNGGLPAGEIFNLISPEVSKNLHEETVEIGERLVRAMRGQ
jgi:hypothetical protein